MSRQILLPTRMFRIISDILPPPHSSAQAPPRLWHVDLRPAPHAHQEISPTYPNLKLFGRHDLKLHQIAQREIQRHDCQSSAYHHPNSRADACAR
jgi:hypothetical protein